MEQQQQEVNELLAAQNLKDTQLLQDKFEDEQDWSDGKLAKVFWERNYSAAKLDAIRKMTIKDPNGNMVHKRVLIKCMNHGRSFGFFLTLAVFNISVWIALACSKYHA